MAYDTKINGSHEMPMDVNRQRGRDREPILKLMSIRNHCAESGALIQYGAAQPMNEYKVWPHRFTKLASLVEIRCHQM